MVETPRAVNRLPRRATQPEEVKAAATAERSILEDEAAEVAVCCNGCKFPLELSERC